MNTKQQYTKCDFCKYFVGRSCTAKPDSYYCKDANNEFFAWLKNKNNNSNLTYNQAKRSIGGTRRWK